MNTSNASTINLRSPTFLGLAVFHVVTLVTAVLWIFGLIHPTFSDVMLGVILYACRMFFITAFYHRYFAHRSYGLRAARFTQFVAGFLGATACQRGPLWWAGLHRIHHRESDTVNDPHSPRFRGFWWAQIGWLLFERPEPAPMRDFSKEEFPELHWLDHWHLLAPALLGLACLLLGGWTTFLIGFVWSTTLLWHGTSTVNSVAHSVGILLKKIEPFLQRHRWLRPFVAVLGYRRHETADTSVNSPILMPVLLGEGWHNNHHKHQGYVRQGERWWEIDIAFCIIWFLQLLGVTKDLRLRRST